VKRAGDRTIPPDVVRACERLQGTGGLRSVARRLGISANAVRGIWARLGEVQVSELQLEPGESFVPQGERCHDCGTTVNVLPCRICRARNFAKERPMERIEAKCPRCGHDEARRGGKQWRCSKCGNFIRNATKEELVAAARAALAASKGGPCPTTTSAKTAGPATSGDGTADRSACA